MIENYLNKQLIIAVTGHRPDKLGGEYEMDGAISNYLNYEFDKILDKYNPEKIVSGMALGVDTIWAIAGLYRGIKLIAAVPFEGQENKWTEESKTIYREILNHELTTVHLCSNDTYHPKLMQKRNEWMVNNSGLLVAVWNGSAGGTENCIKYAKRRKREIIYINLK